MTNIENVSLYLGFERKKRLLNGTLPWTPKFIVLHLTTNLWANASYEKKTKLQYFTRITKLYAFSGYIIPYHYFKWTETSLVSANGL